MRLREGGVKDNWGPIIGPLPLMWSQSFANGILPVWGFTTYILEAIFYILELAIF